MRKKCFIIKSTDSVTEEESEPDFESETECAPTRNREPDMQEHDSSMQRADEARIEAQRLWQEAEEEIRLVKKQERHEAAKNAAGTAAKMAYAAAAMVAHAITRMDEALFGCDECAIEAAKEADQRAERSAMALVELEARRCMA